MQAPRQAAENERNGDYQKYAEFKAHINDCLFKLPLPLVIFYLEKTFLSGALS
jgi:hypothetical protein